MRSILLLLVFASPASAADPPPRVKVELSPKDGAWVGQRVTLAITLYTPDLFAGVPSFEMPPVSGVVVVPPAGSPSIGSERLDGHTFTTQRHEFAVYAQRPGTVRITAFPIRFETNAGFGKPTVKREVATEAVSFEARLPPGAVGLGTVIAARDLKVTHEWKPEPKSPKVGDAFTLTVTTTATDVPGMVFPPMRYDAIDGLAAYPKEPAVNDRTERGTLTGQRTDTITFVCEQPGTVTIPDRTLTWFDLDAKELKTVKLPGRTFEVAPDPNAAAVQEPSSAATTPARAGRGWWWIVPALVAVGLLGWRLAARVWPWWQQVLAGRAESEAAYFARFRRSCHSADPHAVYVALLAWLDHFGPMSPDEFTTRARDPALAALVSALQGQVYVRQGAADPGPWPPARDLATRAARARQRIRSTPAAAASLPPLNPSRS